MVAQSLLAGAAVLDMKALVHVVVLAGSYEEFQSGLTRVIQYAREFLGVPLSSLPDYRKYYPATARSFGSANKTTFRKYSVLHERMASSRDPVYSAKLFLTARQAIRDQALKGNILLVHSGGGLTLTGFMGPSRVWRIGSAGVPPAGFLTCRLEACATVPVQSCGLNRNVWRRHDAMEQDNAMYTPNGLKFNFYFGKFRLKTFVDVKLLSFGKVKISTV